MSHVLYPLRSKIDQHAPYVTNLLDMVYLHMLHKLLGVENYKKGKIGANLGVDNEARTWRNNMLADDKFYQDKQTVQREIYRHYNANEILAAHRAVDRFYVDLFTDWAVARGDIEPTPAPDVVVSIGDTS